MAIVLKPETEEKLRQTAQREGQDVDILADALLAEVLAQREREFTERRGRRSRSLDCGARGAREAL